MIRLNLLPKNLRRRV
nr:Chain B, Competence Protein Piln [Thermus thermophilus HB27]